MRRVFMSQFIRFAASLLVLASVFFATPIAPAVKPAKKPISKPVVAKVAKPVVKSDGWKAGCVTTYAQKFDGRRMAGGKIFRHSGRHIASRCGKFGDRLELRYGRNGKAIVIIGDRGGLPLHRKNRPQFDVSRKVATELGLYRITNGKTDRNVRWRVVQ